MDGREKRLFEAARNTKRPVFYLMLNVMFMVPFIVDVVCSLAFDLRQRHLVIVEKRRSRIYLYDAMVEVPAYIILRTRAYSCWRHPAFPSYFVRATIGIRAIVSGSNP